MTSNRLSHFALWRFFVALTLITFLAIIAIIATIIATIIVLTRLLLFYIRRVALPQMFRHSH